MVKWFSIEELSKKNNNIYALVKTISQRAVDISRGSQPLILKPGSSNPATIALEEIMAEKIEVKTTTQDFQTLDQ